MGSAGLTMVIDRLYGLNKEEFDAVAKHVKIVEIGWGLPLVWERDALRKRIEYYQNHRIRVAAAGTLLERSVLDKSPESTLIQIRGLGFDIVEISDGIIEQTIDQKRDLAGLARSVGLDILYTVGKKDPSAQLSLGETLEQIQAGLKLDPVKVVLESRETGKGVGIYDRDGNVRWDFLRAIVARISHHDLLFEAPSEQQQAALILELGPEVNLGNVSLGSVATLRSERLGLRFDTFGVDKPIGKLEGGPSTKFVLFAVRNLQPVDQRGIASATQLPRRTIQKAIENLLSQGLIIEHRSFEDRRTKFYRTPSFSPMEKVHQS